MDGIRALRIIAYMSISVGIGILSRAAWGFVIFGILVLLDNFVFKSSPPPATPLTYEEESEPVAPVGHSK